MSATKVDGQRSYIAVGRLGGNHACSISAASCLKFSAQSLVQLHSLVLPPPATQSVNDDLHIGTHRVCVFVCSPKAPLITLSPV